MDLKSFCSDLPRRKIDISDSQNPVRFYDFVNSLFTKRFIYSSEFSPKAILKAVSMDSSLFRKCVILSKYSNLEKGFFFSLLRGIFPKRNKGFGFFKYIKWEFGIEQELALVIAKHFHVKISEVGGIIKVLAHENIEIKDVKTFFGFGEEK